MRDTTGLPTSAAGPRAASCRVVCTNRVQGFVVFVGRWGQLLGQRGILLASRVDGLRANSRVPASRPPAPPSGPSTGPPRPRSRRLAAGAVALLVTLAALVAVEPWSGRRRAPQARALLEIPLRQVKLVSYYPADDSWTNMWSHFNPAEIQADFGRLQQLGANTVRISIDPFEFGWPNVTPQMASELGQVLSLAQCAGPACPADTVRLVVELLADPQQRVLAVVAAWGATPTIPRSPSSSCRTRSTLATPAPWLGPRRCCLTPRAWPATSPSRFPFPALPAWVGSWP